MNWTIMVKIRERYMCLPNAACCSTHNDRASRDSYIVKRRQTIFFYNWGFFFNFFFHNSFFFLSLSIVDVLTGRQSVARKKVH